MKQCSAMPHLVQGAGFRAASVRVRSVETAVSFLASDRASVGLDFYQRVAERGEGVAHTKARAEIATRTPKP